jgi:hypothetical protein
LVLLAFAATVVASWVLVTAVVQQARADAGVTCSESPTGQPLCYRALPRGGWQEEQFGADGGWRAVGTARP